MAKNSPRRAPWLISIGIAGLFVLFVVYVPKFSGNEVKRSPSPDGAVDAVLIEVPRDAAGAHSYKVCFYRPNDRVTTAAACNQIAYLAGVSGPQPVELVWTAPRQLEIRYVKATSVHVYKPAFIGRHCWMGPCLGGYSNFPIITRMVQVGDKPSTVSH
jgi:hypothetical protein